MKDIHINYLKKRKFDPRKLEKEWGLLGTGAVGDFKLRIIIPIVQEDHIVCFQGRDCTGKASAKYLSCPDDKAVIPIKKCLYGLDRCYDSTVVITEGVTKVWRLGPGSVATFGATVTDMQVLLLKRFTHRTIIFDNDEAGREGADRLANKLSVLGGVTQKLFILEKNDVGEITNEEAAWLMKRIKNK